MGRKKKSLPATITEDLFISAIRNRGAYVNEIAEELQISPYMVKETLLRNSKLREVYMDVKEAVLDKMEGALVSKALDDKNLLAMMFYLKCQGKERGWIDTPIKNTGDSAEKPLHIKIVGITGVREKEVGKAKVVEQSAEVTIPALTDGDVIEMTESSFNEFEEDESKQFYGG